MISTNIASKNNYWNNFYKKNHKHSPSQFCVLILTEVSHDTTMVELGSGNGRDSHYFAVQGHVTAAIDMSEQGIESSLRLAKERQIHHISFTQGDLTEQLSVEGLITAARQKVTSNKLAFYSRFVMHSLDDEQEMLFLKYLSACMLAGEIVYFEFRTKEDEQLTKYFGEHFRRYIDFDRFKKRLVDQFNFEISYSIKGQGMAKFKDEDPFVCRIFAKKI